MYIKNIIKIIIYVYIYIMCKDIHVCVWMDVWVCVAHILSK